MRTLTLGVGLLCSLLASTAAAQGTRWQTIAGGDASGDYVSVDRPVASGTLGGARTVERLTRTTGYTTGRPPVREVFAYWPALIAKSAVTPVVEVV